MEADLQDSLSDLGYSGDLLNDGELEKSVQGGLGARLFVKLVIWLGEQFEKVCKVEEKMHPLGDEDDLEGFKIELRGFLKEIGCPHKMLVNFSGGEYLADETSRWKLIDFLVSEVSAARILTIHQPRTVIRKQRSVDSNPAGESFQRILQCLDLSPPPASVPMPTIFSTLETKIKKLLEDLPRDHISPPLIVSPLQRHQLEALNEMNKKMEDEYYIRRQMLLKRADVTIQSLKWSDKTKGKEEALEDVFKNQRLPLKDRSHVSLAQVLAARQDLLNVVKTSNDAVRSHTQTPINKVLIGRVPDRGGRPNETRPPTEMPSFKSRWEAPKERREPSSGGQRKGRGNQRIQGGWAGSRQDSSGGRQDWSRQDSSGSGKYSRQSSEGWGGTRKGKGRGNYSGEAGGGGRRTVYES
ncbi:protein FAM98B-like [Oscarella lobularis]|uniref:protein FAM98B-like n=1 Tax=Oscarella lobularis TaxID=121494 RepID=UPI0033133323